MSIPPNAISEISNAPNWLKLSPQLQKYDLIVGWDTEYTQLVDSLLCDPISYQYAAYFLPDDLYVEGIIYAQQLVSPKSSYSHEKISLSFFLQYIFRKLNLNLSAYKLSKLKVLLVSHYSLAEFSMFSDRNKYANYLSEIHKTLSATKCFFVTFKWDSTHSAKVSVAWRDVYLLAPSDRSRSLAVISQGLACEKIDLEKECLLLGITYDKSKLRDLIAINPLLFERYALFDARAVLEYYSLFFFTYYELTSVTEDFLTISESVVLYYLKELAMFSSEISEPSLYRKLVGFREKDNLQRLSTKKNAKEFSSQGVKHINRSLSEEFTSLCYLGGINTSYHIGRFQSKEFLVVDCDLAQAYPTALATIPFIDWDSLVISSFPQKLKKKASCNQIGFYQVKFNYLQKNVLQPIFPINTLYGLVYPWSGTSFCTAFELEEGIRQGCNITVEKSYTFSPLKHKNRTLMAFSWFLAKLIKKRKEYPTNSFFNLLLKLMANSFYGKLAQGIIDRMATHPLKKKTYLKPSKITVPHYAAITTGLVRTVIVSIINKLNALGFRVLNCTTDGFMVVLPKPLNFTENFEKSKLKPQSFRELWPTLYTKLSELPILQSWKKGLKQLGIAKDEWLVIKHIGDEAATWKTRANYISYQNNTQNLARGNIPTNLVKTKEDLIGYADKEGKERLIPNSRLTNFKEIVNDNIDLCHKIVGTKTIDLDYDWKRILNEEGKTRPPNSIAEWETFLVAREKLHFRGKRADVLNVYTTRLFNRVESVPKRTILRILLNVIFKLKWSKKRSIRTLVKILENWRKEHYPEIKEIRYDTIRRWTKKRLFLHQLPNIKIVKDMLQTLKKALDFDLDFCKENLLFRQNE